MHVVFCREAMERRGSCLPHPKEINSCYILISYPGTLGPISGISPLETLQHATATPITTPNYRYLKMSLEESLLFIRKIFLTSPTTKISLKIF